VLSPSLARLLVPQRRIVRGADKLGTRKPVERPVELNRLVGIERVHAATSPARHVVRQDGRHAIAQLERLSLQAIDQPELHQHPLEQRHAPAHGREAAADVGTGRPVVERAIEHETHQRFEVELMRRHAEHDARLRRRRVADRSAVAERAVEPDLIDPEPPAPRHADRQVVAGFDDQPDRRKPSGQPIAADRRQCLEDLVRGQHAADGRQ
jgi:hypothetical protein